MRDWGWKKYDFLEPIHGDVFVVKAQWRLHCPALVGPTLNTGMFNRVTFWPSNMDKKRRSRPSIDLMFVVHRSGKPVISSCPLKRIIMVMEIILIRSRSLKVPHNNNNDSIMTNKTKDTLIWKCWPLRKPMLNFPCGQ